MRHEPPQAAQFSHVARAAFMIDDAGGHEERSLERCVVEDVEHRSDGGERRVEPEQKGNESEVADGGIGKQSFEIMFEHRDIGGEHHGDKARGGHHVLEQGGVAEHEVEPGVSLGPFGAALPGADSRESRQALGQAARADEAAREHGDQVRLAHHLHRGREVVDRQRHVARSPQERQGLVDEDADVGLRTVEDERLAAAPGEDGVRDLAGARHQEGPREQARARQGRRATAGQPSHDTLPKSMSPSVRLPRPRSPSPTSHQVSVYSHGITGACAATWASTASYASPISGSGARAACSRSSANSSSRQSP